MAQFACFRVSFLYVFFVYFPLAVVSSVVSMQCNRLLGKNSVVVAKVVAAERR